MKALNVKDLEWSKENLPAMSQESENAEEKENDVPAIEPPNKKMSSAQKVSITESVSFTSVFKQFHKSFSYTLFINVFF